MKKVTITRGPSTGEGCFGIVTLDFSDWTCVSGELPWKDDRPDVSCIPAGVYVCKWTDHPRHGWVFQIFAYDQDTGESSEIPGAAEGSYRTDCLIHSANLMGDVTAGYVSQLEGCVALGTRVSVFPANVPPAGTLDQRGVTDSKNTLLAFQGLMGTEDFLLQIMAGSCA